MALITCESHDFVVVYYKASGDRNRECPVCEMEKELSDLKNDNEELKQRVTELDKE